MKLRVLPERTAGAAENMAIDFLLLQRWPGAVEPRCRHYEWRGPAFTFGYSQKLWFVKSQLPPEEGAHFDLCRRPTGGGVVDHREDWTYTVVVPRGHPLEETRASESYRLIHAAMVRALRAQGVRADQATGAPPPPPGEEAGAVLPGVCFQRAELHDVIGPGGAKIAGAAQKRSKQGLLFQGSIWKPAAEAAVPGRTGIDWDRFGEDFFAELGAALELEVEPAPCPEFAEGELEGLTEQYSAPEWMEFR